MGDVGLKEETLYLKKERTKYRGRRKGMLVCKRSSTGTKGGKMLRTLDWFTQPSSFPPSTFGKQKTAFPRFPYS